MEDLTQMGSLSPTQENPASVYAHYARQVYVGSSPDANSQALGKKDSGHTQEVGSLDPLLAKHHSTVTDSTAQTYGEHDTGHVHFDDFTINENPAEENSPDREESLSQDASFAPAPEVFPSQQPYEPQTPAPPVNPFLQKGSVMKSHEMFKATQPSSVGRHLLSATSSRPSPDVYHDFTSPAKWMPPSSPLVRRFEHVESSPLHSSVRTLLRSKSIEPSDDLTTPQKSGPQSFRAGPKSSLQSSMREPLQYVSMKESQERRRKETSSSSTSSDTESDSDLDDIPTKRQRERRLREEEIQKQLSAVELHKHAVTSSTPASPTPGEVEVPSTSSGRRRSVQEEYIAQCEGTDARDTQQDDFIADSQTVLDKAQECVQERVTTMSREPEVPQNGTTGNVDSNTQQTPSLLTPCCDTEIEPVQDPNSNTNSDRTANVPEGPSSQLPQLSLPLKEVSTNSNGLRTPSICKTSLFSDGAEMTVPETSPAADHIRPIGEISFGENNTDELQGLPGFTQDTEFDNAILSPSSPDPPPRRTRARYSVTHPVISSTIASESQSVSNEANDVTSERQSSAPPSVIPEGEPMTNPHDHTESMDIGTGSGVATPTPLPATSRGETGATTMDNANNQESNNTGSEPFAIPTRKASLRSKAELKGPSRSLRRSGPDADPIPLTTPRQPSRAAKSTPATRAISTPLSNGATSSPAIPSSRSSVSTPRNVATRSSTQKARQETPVIPQRKPPTAKTYTRRTLSTLSIERPAKRKSTAADESGPPQRESKRRSVNPTRESSADPLSLPQPPLSASTQRKQATKLFDNMAFAVSYVNQQEDKAAMTASITEQGGWILEDGFDTLFKSGSTSKSRNRPGNVEELVVSPAARNTRFVALIADEHSRRVKYMQALALGLPCISGKWVEECISKDLIVDWAPYLLCAGRSSFLGDAIRSRTLQPYSATDSSFPETFAKRVQFLQGKSILAITGKGSTAEKRQHYLFLMRVLGPARFEQVTDLKQARKTLLESEGQQSWDLVYAGDNEKHANEVIFGQAPTTTSAGSKKRKKKPAPTVLEPVPEKVRIINDEDVIQSLILGQLLE